MVPFRFQRLELPDIIVIEPTVFEDDRGMFMEAYRTSDFLRAGTSFTGQRSIRLGLRLSY